MQAGSSQEALHTIRLPGHRPGDMGMYRVQVLGRPQRPKSTNSAPNSISKYAVIWLVSRLGLLARRPDLEVKLLLFLKGCLKVSQLNQRGFSSANGKPYLLRHAALSEEFVAPRRNDWQPNALACAGL